jgi:hypothetical protein
MGSGCFSFEGGWGVGFKKKKKNSQCVLTFFTSSSQYVPNSSSLLSHIPSTLATYIHNSKERRLQHIYFEIVQA